MEKSEDEREMWKEESEKKRTVNIIRGKEEEKRRNENQVESLTSFACTLQVALDIHTPFSFSLTNSHVFRTYTAFAHNLELWRKTRSRCPKMCSMLLFSTLPCVSMRLSIHFTQLLVCLSKLFFFFSPKKEKKYSLGVRVVYNVCCVLCRLC